jgi:hypothetical protein
MAGVSNMNKPLPTERDVLRCIYEIYESVYPGKKPGENDPFISIDVESVAEKLGCKPHLLFGFLYYYLEHKHRYQTGPNSYVTLFAVQAGNSRHAVNFPYLAAILSAHDQEHSKFQWSLGVSLVALALSVGAIIAQLVTA